MELKDQILQTKERKKGFMNAMPESTRKQINLYTKLDKIAKNFWIILVVSLVISGAVYLAACFAATPENRFVVHAILAGLWVAAGIVLAFWIRSLAVKGKKAIGLGAPDYVEELNAINSRLAGLEKAEKQRGRPRRRRRRRLPQIPNRISFRKQNQKTRRILRRVFF